MVEHLPPTYDALGSIPSSIKTTKKSTEQSTLPSTEPCAIKAEPRGAPCFREAPWHPGPHLPPSGPSPDQPTSHPGVCEPPVECGTVTKSRNPGSEPNLSRVRLAVCTGCWLQGFTDSADVPVSCASLSPLGVKSRDISFLCPPGKVTTLSTLFPCGNKWHWFWKAKQIYFLR